MTWLRNFLQRRRDDRAGPWCTCFDDRELPSPYDGCAGGMHCLLESPDAGRPPVRCQGNGRWTS